MKVGSLVLSCQAKYTAADPYPSWVVISILILGLVAQLAAEPCEGRAGATEKILVVSRDFRQRSRVGEVAAFPYKVAHEVVGAEYFMANRSQVS